MQILKASFAFFCYNISMAVIAFGFSPEIAEFIATWLPFNWSIT
jgi:hypothetical protein